MRHCARHRMMPISMPLDTDRRIPVRTTLAIDDDLIRRAEQLTGVKERAALVREGLKALIARESARRLALMGGSEPELKTAPRRRTVP